MTEIKKLEQFIKTISQSLQELVGVVEGILQKQEFEEKKLNDTLEVLKKLTATLAENTTGTL